MRLSEKSILGVRAARHMLSSPDRQTGVTLVPRIHVAAASLYERVDDDAGAHDVMLAEGVGLSAVKLLTRSFRGINTAKLGRVVQPRSPIAGQCPTRIIHADLSTSEFAHEWRNAPRWI